MEILFYLWSDSVLYKKDCNGKPDPKFLRRVTPKSIAFTKFNCNNKKDRQFSIPLIGVGANNKKLRKPESLARTDREFF